MARTYSVRDILTKKYDLIKWSSKFSEHFGFPENRGVWFIAGMTGSGKSTFVYDLISELSLLGRVLINSLEEATDYTVQQKVINSNLHDKKVNVNWCRENTAELTMRLKKRRSPKYVIIDSIQYLDCNFKTFLKLEEQFPDKLFIVISQVSGKRIKGKTADDIFYHASQKWWTEGFRAISRGRLNVGNYYTIYDKGAAEYWGKKNEN